MTTRRWVGRILGYGTPIIFLLLLDIANRIHWPQPLLASNNISMGFTIFLASMPLLVVFILDMKIPSKPSFLESPPKDDQGQRS